MARPAIGPWEGVEAALCLGDVAVAESHLIAMLRSERHRHAVLGPLQGHSPDADRSTGQVARDEALKALKRRPAVRAAIDQVGRIVEYPSPSLGQIW